jgi:hypothetical protein
VLSLRAGIANIVHLSHLKSCLAQLEIAAALLLDVTVFASQLALYKAHTEHMCTVAGNMPVTLTCESLTRCAAAAACCHSVGNSNGCGRGSGWVGQLIADGGGVGWNTGCVDRRGSGAGGGAW